jgi:DNA-binding response OmpR family regulator
LGADDYVIKPFRQLELLARIKASVRRQYLPDNETSINCWQFQFYMSSHKIQREGKTIRLTSIESLILYQLISNQGRVVTYQALAERIWGTDYILVLLKLSECISEIYTKNDGISAVKVMLVNKPGLGYIFKQPLSRYSSKHSPANLR